MIGDAGPAPLLALLQIGDSAFPIGAYAHSYGLEELIREGRIDGPDAAIAYIASTVVGPAITADAVATARVCEAMRLGDLATAVEVDHDLHAMKGASALRQASTSQGRRLLEELAATCPTDAVATFLGAIRDGATPGTHAAALGVAAAGYDAPPASAAAVLALGLATAMLQAAMRLLPLSHRDVQKALHQLRPTIAEASARLAAEPPPLAALHPLQEIAAMRRRCAAVRQFAS
ncbi:MAG TPA: urease accessory UreF family protein [Dehalococcoidia bacterium]|nr:urease accessory UreF family protein [Dehalococcoidia bacterium]